ncbi:MAG: hypothetical protein BWK78_03200 [Thiotrichaceae bacterium IS1]|nr:MAG: hypothetical protein BWK78_03200 [Thiotrichaceae bacterium IS1]
MATPVGASLFTRKTEQNYDYDWKYVQTGNVQLLEIAKKIHVTVLCREYVGDTETVKFAVIQKGQRIGFLIADLSSSRCDFANKTILTTLYLEFTASEKVAVLNAAATLLDPSSQEWQVFLDYAEDLFKNSYSSPKPIQLSNVIPIPSSVTVTNLKKRGLVFSPIGNRYQYATYVTHIPDNFCFVSTGYVGFEKYQELSNVFGGTLLILTLEESVENDKPLSSRQPLSKKLPANWTTKKVVSGLVAMVLILSVGYWVIQIQELKEQLTKAEKKLSDSKKQIEDKDKEISVKDKEMSVKDKKISALEKQLNEVNHELSKLTAQVATKQKSEKKSQETGEVMPKTKNCEGTGKYSYCYCCFDNYNGWGCCRHQQDRYPW